MTPLQTKPSIGCLPIRQLLCALTLCLLCTLAVPSALAALIPNDDFINATSLGDGLPQATMATNLEHASSEILEPVPWGYDVPWGNSYPAPVMVFRSAWWVWRAVEDGWVDISLSPQAGVGVYEGTSLENINERQTTSPYTTVSHSSFHALAGHVYHLRIIGSVATTCELHAAPANQVVLPSAIAGPFPTSASGPIQAQSLAPAVGEVVRPLPSDREVTDVIARDYYGSRAVAWAWTCPLGGRYGVLTNGAFQLSKQTSPTSEESLATDVSPLTHYREFTAETGANYVLRRMTSWESEAHVRIRPVSYEFHTTRETAAELGNDLPTHGRMVASPEDAVCWWRWTAPSTGAICLPTGGIKVYDDDMMPLEAPQIVFTEGSSLQYLEVSQGQHYNFQMYSGGPTHFIIRAPAVERPPNDNFANASELGAARLVSWIGVGQGEVVSWDRSGVESAQPEALILSSFEPAEPIPPTPPLEVGGYFMEPKGSLWWQWTAPRSEIMALRGLQAAYVYTGSSLETLVPVPLATTREGDEAWFLAIAGTRYFIADVRTAEIAHIDYRYQAEQEPNQIQLWLFPVAATPFNDEFSDRTPVSKTTTPYVYAFLPEALAQGTASIQSGEPTPPVLSAEQPPMGSTWWTWTCEASGYYQFFRDSGPDIQGRVYVGSSLAGLQELVDDGGGIPALAGKSYIIARYHLPNSSVADPGGFRLITADSYKLWVSKFSWTTEASMAATANPTGDGTVNLIKFLCGLDPTKQGLTDDPNAANAPQMVTTAAGERELRFKLHHENWKDGYYANGHGYLQASRDLIHWEIDYSYPDIIDESGFTHRPIPPPTDGKPLFYRLEFSITYDP